MEIIAPSRLSKGIVKAGSSRIVKYVAVRYTDAHHVLAAKKHTRLNKNNYTYHVVTLNGIPVISPYSHYIEDVYKNHIQNLKTDMI